MAKGGVCKTSIQRFDSARRLQNAGVSPLCLPHGHLLFLLLVLVAAAAQQCLAEAKVLQGLVASVDSALKTVRLNHGSRAAVYRIQRNSKVIIGRRAAELSQLRPGLKVIVRFHADGAEPYPVYDLCDEASWPWLQRMRRDVVEGIVASKDGRGIVLEDAAQKGLLHYRVTAKSRIEIQGRAASLADLQAGTRIWLAPRLLPNGDTMATAIADTEAGARRLKERAQPTVTGVVTAWDRSKSALALDTVAGDKRVLTVLATCTVREDKRDLKLSDLRPGLYVTAHIRRTDGGAETVHRITVKSPPAGATNRPK